MEQQRMKNINEPRSLENIFKSFWAINQMYFQRAILPYLPPGNILNKYLLRINPATKTPASIPSSSPSSVIEPPSAIIVLNASFA